MRTLLLPLTLVFVLNACLPRANGPPNAVSKAPPSSSRGGYTFDLSKLTIKPSTPMIAKPFVDKLFVIIDPAQVEDNFLIDNSTHGVEGFLSFYQNSLKVTLGAYFSNLDFVTPAFVFPDAPHFVAQAKVTRITVNSVLTGQMRYDVLEMNWAFAIRPSTQEEFLFSFSGVAKSEMSYYSMDIGCQQLMTSAMHGLLQAWSDKGVYNALASPARPGNQEQSVPTGQGEKPVLAIFDIQDASRKLDTNTLVQLTIYLSTLLVQQGKYSVIPRDQVRARLLDEKKGSYKQCIDEGCQIELGKALAAQKTLSTVLIKVGEKCVLTSTLLDLRTETAQEGAAVETTCATNELLGAMKQIAPQL